MRYRMTMAILAMATAFAATTVPAQQRLVTLTKGNVTAVLDTYSGRFAARTAEGARLLFARDDELTSHISVALDNEIYTNYTKSDIAALWPLHALGRGETHVLADRIRHTWRLGSRYGERRVILELEPVLDSLYNEVRVHVLVENGTSRTFNVGMTVMEDVCAGADDKVGLRNGATPLEYERRFDASELPERLMMMSGGYHPDSAYCRLLGDGLTTPDAVTVGRWLYHSALGTATYGYTASGIPIWDTAVLAQWDRTNLLPGQRRAVSTAVGLAGKQPHGPGTSGTFAREFIVPMLYSGLLSIICDTVATVRITTPYCDGTNEALSDQNRMWDTTVTVSPNIPIAVLVSRWILGPRDLDSVPFYTQKLVLVNADQEIGIVVRPLNAETILDAATIWPVAWWDSLYLFHGTMGFGVADLHTNWIENSVCIYNTLEYVVALHTQPYSGGWPIQGGIAIDLPSRASFSFQSGSSGEIYNHWAPRKPSERTLTPDGAGDLIIGQRGFSLAMRLAYPLYPGGRVFERQVPRSPSRYLMQPSRRQLGSEYVFVPFHKRNAKVQSDLLRIMAYDDGTELKLLDGTPFLALERAEYVDTLLSTATVIRSNKPVAVYQHHLAQSYLQSDTMLAGAAFALLPPELWGNRYHVWTSDIFAKNIGYHEQSWDLPDVPPYYDNLYVIVVTRASNRAGVLLNDVPVDAGKFTVFGDYAYAYIDITSGYYIVTSDQPLLTVVCGGGGNSRYGKLLASGMSWIPPFTSSSGGGGTIKPKHDEREGKLDTYIPRD